MPRTYFAHNRVTDELIASPNFKRVYDAVLYNLRCSDKGCFRIYAVDADIDTYTYAQVLPQFTLENLRCKLSVQPLSNRIKIVEFPSGNFIKIPKRDERIFDF